MYDVHSVLPIVRKESLVTNCTTRAQAFLYDHWEMGEVSELIPESQDTPFGSFFLSFNQACAARLSFWPTMATVIAIAATAATGEESWQREK